MKILLNELSKMSNENALYAIMNDDVLWEESEIMNNWNNFGFICKDVFGGEIFKVKELTGVNNNTFTLLCEGGVNLTCNIKKERKFFEMLDGEYDDLNHFIAWLNSDEGREWFVINDTRVQCVETINGSPIGSLYEAHLDYQREEFINEIKNPTKVYKAYIKDKNVGGFIVIINGVEAFLPGSLAAANKIVNFDSFIGKTTNVMFEDYIKDGDTFIVSNKKYITKILPEKLKSLKFDQKYFGEVTGVSKFGIFIEFDDIFTGLLHTSEMLETTKNKFNERQFGPGTKVEFYIKEILKDNRIILSESPRSNDFVTIEQFKEMFEGKNLEGLITSQKPYGYFIKFKVNENYFTGLLYIKEVQEPLRIGSTVSCYIENIDVDANKIFLKLSK